jgi:hypothetical protein
VLLFAFGKHFNKSWIAKIGIGYEKRNCAADFSNYRYLQYSCGAPAANFFFSHSDISRQRRRKSMGYPGKGFYRNDECQWGVLSPVDQAGSMEGFR